MVSLVGGNLDHLVGADGAVLDALQELTRLAVLRETGERSRLMLDIAGWRAAKRDGAHRVRDDRGRSRSRRPASPWHSSP